MNLADDQMMPRVCLELKRSFTAFRSSFSRTADFTEGIKARIFVT